MQRFPEIASMLTEANYTRGRPPASSGFLGSNHVPFTVFYRAQTRP